MKKKSIVAIVLLNMLLTAVSPVHATDLNADPGEAPPNIENPEGALPNDDQSETEPPQILQPETGENANNGNPETDYESGGTEGHDVENPQDDQTQLDETEQNTIISDEQQVTEKSENSSELEEPEAEKKTETDDEGLKNSEENAKARKVESNTVSVQYSAHVQNIGWQSVVKNGDVGGTTGRNLRIEAIKIKLENGTKYAGNIEYKMHVQNIGWQSFVSGDQIGGTTGRSLAAEAIQIRLTGELSKYYDVYYRVYSDKYGWLDWTCNGGTAGSSGLSYPANAIQIKVLKKDDTSRPAMEGKPHLYVMNQGNVMYRAHCQDVGWQNYTWDGRTAGTVGRSKRMEALTISVSEFAKRVGVSGSVAYQAHCQDIGWQSEVTGDNIAGTVGRGKRMEAIKIRLTGDLANKYDIYYRVHSAEFGWLAWTRNGQSAGSEGYGRSIEAIEINIVAKGTTPSYYNGGRSFHSTENLNKIQYNASVRGAGWQGNRSAGQTAGTVGQSKCIEGIKISLGADNAYTGGVKYQVHVSDVGWMSWASNGAAAGRIGEKKQIEAVKIQLTGEISSYADVYYRAHIQDYGWMGWTKNGQPAGSSACGYRMEALQVVILPKGSAAPGTTQNSYTESKISRMLASFSTRCTNTDAAWYNMSRALMSFNGMVVGPGQTVSFFDVAGPCGASQGYLPAGVVGGIGYGGGICQASTTLYGGILRAGLAVVERRNHSVPSSYVPIGQDAMVNYGTSDFKFRNPFSTSVTIRTYATGDRRLVVEIYGRDQGWFDRVDIQSWWTGSNSAAAQRLFFKNGNVVKYETLPSSYY